MHLVGYLYEAYHVARSLEHKIYAVLAAPCATIPIPYTKPAELSATIAAVLKEFMKTTKFLGLKEGSAFGIERGHSRTGSSGANIKKYLCFRRKYVTP